MQNLSCIAWAFAVVAEGDLNSKELASTAWAFAVLGSGDFSPQELRSTACQRVGTMALPMGVSPMRFTNLNSNQMMLPTKR